MTTATPDVIFHNGRITTLDRSRPRASAVAVKDGRFVAVGDDAEVLALAGAGTRRVDLKRRAVLPGLYDNHTHVVRGGLNYNMELRWDGVRSLADAMAMLKRQVAITPAPQWVRVVGGFTEHQFAEKRLPTIEELNAVAPDTPVFILHLYDRALLNGAALRGGLHQDHAQSAGRRDPARRAGQSHRAAAGQAQRHHPVRHAGQGAEAALRLPAQFHAPFHARIEPSGRDRRDRRRRRLPELSRRLCRHPAAGRRQSDDRAAGLQPVHAEAKAGEGGLPQLDRQRAVQAGHGLLPSQRRRRDAGVLGRRFRGLPRRAAGHAAGNGRRAGGSGARAGAEPLALAPACHL